MGISYVLLLFILTNFFQIYYIASAIISYAFLIALSYYLNDKWTFGSRNGDQKIGKSWHRLCIYYSISLIGMGLNVSILYILTEFADIYYLVSSMIATCVVFLWSYLLNKKITWGYLKRAEKDGSE